MRIGLVWAVVEPGDDEGHAAGAQHRTVHRAVHGGGGGAEPRARRHPPAQMHPALEPLHPAGELGPGQATGEPAHQGVGDPHPAAGGAEGRLEHVGVRHVPAVDRERFGGRQFDAAAVVRVEDAGEDRLRVHTGHRQPVDRAVTRDEGDGAPVSDGGIGAQIRVAVPIPERPPIQGRVGRRHVDPTVTAWGCRR